MPNLAIIIVSWNVCDLLRCCLRAVEASLAGSAIACEIIVVDNGSADGTPAMLRAEFPQVRLLEPGRNLGFAGGNNLALRALGFGQEQVAENREQRTANSSEQRTAANSEQQRTANSEQQAAANSEQRSPSVPCSPPFVLLLNPDTEPVGDALPRLVRYLAAHPELAAAGPQLRYGDGSLQSSRRRFPQRLTFFWESTPLERLWPGNPWARRYRCADKPGASEQPVGWLVGAALLVRASAIAAAGLLDEGFFMYSEELEWQLRMQESGVRSQESGVRSQESGVRRKRGASLRDLGSKEHSCIAYLPEAVVIHYEGKSSEQVPAARHLNFQRSKIRLAQLLYGRAFARLLRLFLLLCYQYELLAEGGKLLLGHRPELRRRRIGIYAELLSKL